jgi:arylsulfatase A-like enzyme
MDGVDMAPILFGKGPGFRNTMFYYRGDELFAVRKGRFKAHFQTALGYGTQEHPLKFEKHDPPLLFDLEADPSEKFNLAAEHPQRVAEIIQEADKHRASLVVGKPQY